MMTGFQGTFVISWQQTEVDGQKAATTDELTIGATWRWSGRPVRVDGSSDVLCLGMANGEADLRKRAARVVRRLVGVALEPTQDVNSIDIDDPLFESSFVVTDGRRTFTVTIIDVAKGSPPLLMMLDDLPPTDTDLWIVHRIMSDHTVFLDERSKDGVICFTPGTWLRAPDGPKLIEDLVEGDRVCTKDSGDQEICWIGQRRMSGARLHALPHLRPIRIRAGALLGGEPDQDLVVSPDHRILIKGSEAQILFNTPEVLVAAKDLLNDRTILVDHGAREVTYIHLLLDSHQIVWANGIETESFHPVNTSLSSIEEEQRARMLHRFPDIADDPNNYGGFARRNLTDSEAAILRYKVA